MVASIFLYSQNVILKFRQLDSVKAKSGEAVFAEDIDYSFRLYVLEADRFGGECVDCCAAGVGRLLEGEPEAEGFTVKI